MPTQCQASDVLDREDTAHAQLMNLELRTSHNEGVAAVIQWPVGRPWQIMLA